MNQKFTGQEHDVETALDFFQARYHANQQGRFMSVDPGQAGADITNPQSWNGYGYVLNSPMVNTDPDGTDTFDPYGDPCDGDPFCGWGDPFPPTFPGPSDQPQPPPPPPPPPVSTGGLNVPNSGVYGQQGWGTPGAYGLDGAVTEAPPAAPSVDTDPGMWLRIALSATRVLRYAPWLFVIDVVLDPRTDMHSEADWLKARTPQPIASPSRRKWTCTASCNVQGISEPPPFPRVTGVGVGSNEAEACLNAKRAATQAAPPGTYARHCQCACSN